jgi:hypothetical protein
VHSINNSTGLYRQLKTDNITHFAHFKYVLEEDAGKKLAAKWKMRTVECCRLNLLHIIPTNCTSVTNKIYGMLYYFIIYILLHVSAYLS